MKHSELVAGQVYALRGSWMKLVYVVETQRYAKERRYTRHEGSTGRGYYADVYEPNDKGMYVKTRGAWYSIEALRGDGDATVGDKDEYTHIPLFTMTGDAMRKQWQQEQAHRAAVTNHSKMVAETLESLRNTISDYTGAYCGSNITSDIKTMKILIEAVQALKAAKQD